MDRLRRLPGKDMVIYGSGSLVASLTKHKLIDDYRIFVSPNILGKGKQLFSEQPTRLNLRLQDTRAFSSGLVLLHYVLNPGSTIHP
jgi:dihydrofolate reductase